MGNKMNYEIDREILTINGAICESIDTIDASQRGFLSQTILQQLRHLVEHVALKVYADKKFNAPDIKNNYDNIPKAVNFIKTRANLKFLRKFHDFLQISVSHYTLDKDGSVRLMLKYYEYLLKIKGFLKTNYSLDVLHNIEKFPLDMDSTLNEYYEKIACKIDQYKTIHHRDIKTDRYYIQKIKPFFVCQKVYYEVTFSPASEKTSKFDRVIAFTALDISNYYAVRLSTVNACIEIHGNTMPVIIIMNWECSIRPCEINNFSKIFDKNPNIQTSNSEYKMLMQYLTDTGNSLVDLIDSPDGLFTQVQEYILQYARTSNPFFEVLSECRALIKNNLAGSNVLRYLLYSLNNTVIKKQYENINNSYLSDLSLKYGCIPFDRMPFNSSLVGHNPQLWSLFDCLDSSKRRHELFARLIMNNTEINGQLFTPVSEIDVFDEIDSHITQYNNALYYKHHGRKLIKDKDHVFIQGYEEDTSFIIDKLKENAADGISNYSISVNSWINSSTYSIDCEEKRDALIQMFEKSRVALIYGAAGTGKSTLINHISHFFADSSKLFLANTNPAADNLKRKVSASNSDFMTITKFVKRERCNTNYDILIIDECSTVSNRDMRDLLEKATFKVLVLVGDVFQIEAIRFGNWFSIAQGFVPETSVFELTKPYRSNNDNLIELWDRVRNMEENELELLVKEKYSSDLDNSIFEPAGADEIILCLNYDGLYGINNINRFLQENNQSEAVHWGLQIYKVDDPVLFNDSNRFAPLIHNNMKGRIANIEVLDRFIQFDIELDKAVNDLDICVYDGLTLIGNSINGNSVVRFCVDRHRSTDDDETTSSAVTPFQVAYAVSIHKAQGLEFDSVKIVITDEIDEMVSHNIFYTAITRAKENLKIYWTPEVGQKVLSSIKPRDYRRDVSLLKSIK